ncbi:MAG: metallophosphoesterase family protein [Thermoflexibacteraceae bacterium]
MQLTEPTHFKNMTIGKTLSYSAGGLSYVVADVHGCVKTLQHLLEKRLLFSKKDQLFLLGDYINKGKDSKGVLDYLIELKRKGFLVFPLRGNHEEELLNRMPHFYAFQKYIRANSLENLLDEQGKLAAKYLRFLEKLPYYYELPQHLLVHAGFNFEISNPYEDTKAMLWIRQPVNGYAQYTEKTIIHGHQPVPLEVIQRSLATKSKVIPLDNGCVYAHRKMLDIPEGYLGRLCALCLENHELYVQENID